MWLPLHFSWTALQSCTWLEGSSRQQTCLTIPSPHLTPGGERPCLQGPWIPGAQHWACQSGLWRKGADRLSRELGSSWHTRSTAWLPGSSAVWRAGEPTLGDPPSAGGRQGLGCHPVRRAWLPTGAQAAVLVQPLNSHTHPLLTPSPSASLVLGPSASGWPLSRAPEPSPLVTSDLAGGGGGGAGCLGDDLWGQTVSDWTHAIHLLCGLTFVICKCR